LGFVSLTNANMLERMTTKQQQQTLQVVSGGVKQRTKNKALPLVEI